MAQRDGEGSGGFRDKLVRTKEAWARDGRLLTGHGAQRTQRLPPGQRLVTDWPVLDLGVQPAIPLDRWWLEIGGAVARPQRWTWADFLAQPQVRITSDIHCVTAWSRYDNVWDGVSTAHLVAMACPHPDARHVVLHGHDGYSTNVRLDHFTAPDALLAHAWAGRPLTTEHGGPVRIVIPQFYFWKSAKWICRIEFTVADHPGFWEVRGYHNEGDPWAEERYDR